MIYTPDDVFIDHESFSAADLKKVGSYAYAEHPSTEILLTTYAFGDEPVEAYDATAGGKIPSELRDLLRYLQRNPGKKGNPKLIGANYLLFDRLLLKNCWGFDIDPRDIIDTMVCAFRHSLPGSLAMQCEVLQVAEELAKDKRGKALIQRFCKPTPKNYKVRRYSKETHPAEWEEFIAYAKSDITAMREVFYELPTWGNIDFENTVLAVDQRINDRGFFVDTALANAAIDAVKQHKIELQQEANDKYGAGLTGAAFLPTLRELAPAHEILNAQKSTLNDLLADDELPDDARAIVEMRLGASSTASTKYNPLLLGLSADGRRRGCLQYGGAKRTLRWAGRGFQPQNLARGHFAGEELDHGIELLLKGRAHWLYDISKLTASTVRGCIIPTAGNKLVVADYSNVEGRGLAWLAGEETALATFLAGLDIYCVTAGKMFGLDPDHIKQMRKDLRQIGKACLHRHTQVLTDTGFKDIMAISSTDKVWNGEKWVNTSGAKLMGWKPVMFLDGVQMTEDHLILSNSWKEAKQLASNENMKVRALEKGMEGWSSFVNYQNATGTACCSRNATAGRCPVASATTTYVGVKHRSVTPAQWKQQSVSESNSSVTGVQCETMNTARDYSTDCPRQSGGATGQKINSSKTTAVEESVYIKNGTLIKGRFFSTFKLWRAGITQNSKWTGKITTATTNLETFGLSAVKRTSIIDEALLSFSGVTMLPLPGLLNLNGKFQYCEPVYDLINVESGNRFLIKSASGYLLAHNCELGLGYGGGVAAFLTFAKNLGLNLYDMAEVMKGTFPDHIWAAARRGYEYARIQEKNKRGFNGQKPDRPSYDLPKNVWLTCDSIKRMWRESHPATCQFWSDLEAAAMNAIKDPGVSYWAGAAVRENGDRAIKITRTFTKEKGERVPGWWLKVELPSGRILSYPGIGISVEKVVEEEPDETDSWVENGKTVIQAKAGAKPVYRERIRYMGENQTTRQWGKQYTYGGKLAENITQALCRDLLAVALVRVDNAGWPIILHVHDEIVTEVPNRPEYSVAKLEEMMCGLPSWAAGFPLAAEGSELFRYAK